MKFRVTIEKSNADWMISDVFNSYEEAQAWRHTQEALLLKQEPNRNCVRSNLLFVREGVQ